MMRMFGRDITGLLFLEMRKTARMSYFRLAAQSSRDCEQRCLKSARPGTVGEIPVEA